MKREQLPDNPDELKDIIHNLFLQVENLQTQIRILQGQRFAQRSEKNLISEQFRQLTVFGEPEEPQESKSVEEITVPAHKRKKPKRKPLPENLPCIEVVHDIPEEQKTCSCGARLERIGKESSDRLDIVPMQVRVIRTIRYKYACPKCQGIDDEGPTVKIAPVPPHILPKALATVSTVVAVIIGKFADGLPLYRQQKIFARMGIEINRSTMAEWLIKVAEQLRPIIALLEKCLLCGPLVNVDETPIQVLREKGRANTTKSFMWVFRGGDPSKPVVLFRYSPTRTIDTAAAILRGYEGYCQTDGYQAYESLEKTHPGLRLVGCFVHVRRNFAKIIRGRGKKAAKKPGHAQQALAYIAKLYKIEKEGKQKGLSPKEFYAWRKEQAEPVLEEFHNWLKDLGPKVPPSSYLGKAIGYALQRWEKLVRYLEDPNITPDNNRAENAIRPFVVGRKNWLFSGHPNGAHAVATYYTLIETAKACGLDPFRYIGFLLENVPLVQNEKDYEALLPQNITEDDLASYGPNRFCSLVGISTQR